MLIYTSFTEIQTNDCNFTKMCHTFFEVVSSAYRLRKLRLPIDIRLFAKKHMYPFIRLCPAIDLA